MKPPRSGCILLERLRCRGAAVPFNDRESVGLFTSMARAVGQDRRLTAFYDPVCPHKLTDPLPDLTLIRPPFGEQWLETIDEEGHHRGYVVVSAPPAPRDPANASYVIAITAFSMPKGNDRSVPAALAAVRFVFDKDEKELLTSAAPCYVLQHGHEKNGLLQSHAVAPAVVMLQRANTANIGFFEVRDPEEANPKLTRSHRRALIGRRHFVLTIREKADIRAGRKVVERMGIQPLHWSRGHYQHNGPAAAHGHKDGRDRGLAFGWLAGRLWIPAAAKGDAKNGIIDHDYRFPDRAKNGRRRRKRDPHQTVDVPPLAVAFQSSQAAETAAFAAATSPLNQDQPARQEARQ